MLCTNICVVNKLARKVENNELCGKNPQHENNWGRWENTGQRCFSDYSHNNPDSMKQTLTLVSHFEVMLCQMICRLYFWQKHETWKTNLSRNTTDFAILLSNMNRTFWHMNELKTDEGKRGKGISSTIEKMQ